MSLLCPHPETLGGCPPCPGGPRLVRVPRGGCIYQSILPHPGYRRVGWRGLRVQGEVRQGGHWWEKGVPKLGQR